MLHFLGKPGELPGLYDHVLYTLFPKINVSPVFLRFELNFSAINNSLNEICSYLLHTKTLHTKFVDGSYSWGKRVIWYI